MRIHILSDLHADFAAFEPDPAAVAAADAIVLAGDILDGEAVPAWARKTFGNKPIVWVAGNHEFYGSHWERSLMDMRRIAWHCGIHLLENDTITIDGVDFLGATLWTDFEMMGDQSESIALASRWMSDYRQISGCTPLTTIARHRARGRAWS